MSSLEMWITVHSGTADFFVNGHDGADSSNNGVKGKEKKRKVSDDQW
jgi:hypothetical protein